MGRLTEQSCEKTAVGTLASWKTGQLAGPRDLNACMYHCKVMLITRTSCLKSCFTHEFNIGIQQALHLYPRNPIGVPRVTLPDDGVPDGLRSMGRMGCAPRICQEETLAGLGFGVYQLADRNRANKVDAQKWGSHWSISLSIIRVATVRHSKSPTDALRRSIF